MDWLGISTLVVAVGGVIGIVLNFLIQRKIKTAVNGNHHAALREIKNLRKQLREEQGGKSTDTPME